MAGSLTDAVEADFLKLLTGQATTIFTTTPLANIYVALFTTANSDAASGTEIPTGTGYARVNSKGLWGAPSGTSPTTVANNAVITFPTATGVWASGNPIVSAALYDAATNGNRLCWCDLADMTKTVSNGDTISFPIGTLVASQD